LAAGVFACLLSACGPSDTGNELVRFDAFAAGPERAEGSLRFDNELGFEIELARANLLVGALYVNQRVPIAGAGEQPCLLPGTYVAQVTRGRVVDLLDGTPQAFPEAGIGVNLPGFTGEAWLKSDDVALDAPVDPAIIVELRGTARRGTRTWDFEADLTVGQNRRLADPDPKRPGANPICKERIVSPIAVNLTPREGMKLVLRVDPSGWFRDVDFSEFDDEQTVPGERVQVRIPDALTGQASVNLWNGIQASRNYRFQVE
jgi:hypothetical protein